MIKVIYTIFFCLISLFGYSQSKWTIRKEKEKVTIPFQLVNNLVIVKANLNDTDLNLILDTGSNLNMLFSFPEKDSIAFENTSKIKITGPGMDQPIDAYISKKNSIQLKNLKCNDLDVILLFHEELQLGTNIGFPIHGILGADFFKNQIVEIQYAQRKINIYKTDSKKAISIKKGFQTLPIHIKGDKPYLPIDLSVDENQFKTLDLLIDTGLSDGLWILPNMIDYKNNRFIHDFLGNGLGGEIFGDRTRFSQIKFSNFKIENPIVSFPDSIAFSKKNLLIERNGSLGGGILNRFTVIFDYNKNEMCLKPNANYEEPFKYNLSGISIQHSGYDVVEEKIRVAGAKNTISLNEYIFEQTAQNFNYILKPGFEIFYVRMNSVAHNAGLQVGDKIISINNKRVVHYSLAQINELFQSSFDQQITIEIERKGVKIIYKLILKEEI